jgi:hypothetical protein
MGREDWESTKRGTVVMLLLLLLLLLLRVPTDPTPSPSREVSAKTP